MTQQEDLDEDDFEILSDISPDNIEQTFESIIGE
jgi:hypothetical protein